MSNSDTMKRGARSATGPVLVLAIMIAIGGCADSFSEAGGPGGAASLGPSASKALDSRFAALGGGEPSNPSSYLVGPEDVLAISVFQVPDLSVNAQVAANGTITLPLIGVIRAAGANTQQLENEIATKLRAKYLQSPQVSVFIKEYNSQRITVAGMVNSPGAIQLTGDMTLMSAIAQAKGLTDVADARNVMVFRKVDGQKFAARFDVTAIQSGGAPDPRLVRGDMIFVDESNVKAWAKNLLPLVPVAGLFVRFI